MSFRVASLIAAIFALSIANAEATMIDSFDAGDHLYRVSSGSTQDSGQVATSAAIGGYRDSWLKWLNYGSSYVDVLTDSPWTGLAFTQNGEARTTVTWQGATSYALNKDLTADDQFAIDIAYVTDADMYLKMTVYSNGGARASATLDIYVPEDFSGILPVPFASFTETVDGIADPAVFLDIDAIVLELNGSGNKGADILISSVETVPEPSTLVMAVIGGLAFLGVGQRWRRA